MLDSINNKENRERFEDLSSQFFSLIPHDFGRKKMKEFIMDNEEKVKRKLDMLNAL